MQYNLLVNNLLSLVIESKIIIINTDGIYEIIYYRLLLIIVYTRLHVFFILKMKIVK